MFDARMDVPYWNQNVVCVLQLLRRRVTQQSGDSDTGFCKQHSEYATDLAPKMLRNQRKQQSFFSRGSSFRVEWV